MASGAVIGVIVMSLIGAGSFGTMAVMNSDWGMMDDHEGMHEGPGDAWDPQHTEEECEEHEEHEDHEHHEGHQEHEDDEYHQEECCHQEHRRGHHHGH